MDNVLIIALIGVAGGILSATLGVGGGIIFVPALVALLGFPQKSAQGTSLVALVIVASVGAVLYKTRLGIAIDLRMALLLGACGAVGAIIGSAIVAQLPAHVLKRIFAIVMVVVAAKMYITAKPAPQNAAAPQPSTTEDAENRERSHSE